MFACAHPAIEIGIRAPLMLQVVLGLNAQTIASAYLTSPAAMGKRLVRAKDKIRQAGIAVRDSRSATSLPAGSTPCSTPSMPPSPKAGPTPRGPMPPAAISREEALFLARLVSELLPQQPEALGLLALMLHAEARRDARRDAQGEYVPLAEQDQSPWDSQMISRPKRCCVAPPRWRRSAAISWKPRCSRRMSIAAAPVTPTGRRWCSSTTRCSRLPARRSSPSIAPWRIAEVHGAAPRSRRCTRTGSRCAARRIPAILGRARRACWRGRAIEAKRARLRDGDRSRARPRGSQLPAAAPVGVAGLSEAPSGIGLPCPSKRSRCPGRKAASQLRATALPRHEFSAENPRAKLLAEPAAKQCVTTLPY